MTRAIRLLFRRRFWLGSAANMRWLRRLYNAASGPAVEGCSALDVLGYIKGVYLYTATENVLEQVNGSYPKMGQASRRTATALVESCAICFWGT